MKRQKILLSLLMSLILVLAVGVTSGGALAAVRTGNVSGQVLDGPGKDSSDIVLELAGQTISPLANGEFVFSNIPYGGHQLAITVPGDDGRKITMTQTVLVMDPENEVEVVLAGEIELSNPGFEESGPGSGQDIPAWMPGGWNWANRSFATAEYASVSTDRAKEGTRSLKLEGFKLPGATKNALNEPRPVMPGFVYTASAYVYADTDKGKPNPHPMLYIGFFDENNANVGRTVLRSSNRSEDAWEHISVSATAPEDAKTVMVFISSNTNYAGTSYWDDFKLEYSRP